MCQGLSQEVLSRLNKRPDNSKAVCEMNGGCKVLHFGCKCVYDRGGKDRLEEVSEMKRYAFSLFFLSVLILGLSLYFSTNLVFSQSVVPQIPSVQRSCQSGSATTRLTTFSFVPNTLVTFNNDIGAKNCVVQFSTEDALVGTGASIILQWSLDGGACFVAGPEIFRGAPGSFETGTTIAVFVVGAGTHTIRPCWRVNTSTALATFRVRCLTVECNTF